MFELFAPCSAAVSTAVLGRQQRDKITENKEKIKLNKQLPWLVGNVVEVRVRNAVKINYIHRNEASRIVG